VNKIVILGAGPISLTSALALAKYNISSRVFEKNILNEDLFSQDIRNFALTESSMRFFKEINIWDDIKDFTVGLETVYICDNRSDKILELKKNSNPLGYMIKSSDLRTILLDLVQKNSLIELNSNSLYKDIIFNEHSSNIILENEKSVEATLVIAGDGKNSTLREKYFNTSINHDYKQTALIFNIKHTNIHDNSALEHFLPQGCFAILPLINSNESSIVWCQDSKSVDILKKLENNMLLEHLYERAGSSYGKIEIISNIFSYPLSASLISKYYFKNIALIGDAAHVIHPLAGQGLNQGVKDINSLVDLIRNYTDLGLIPDSYMLHQYQKSRKLDNLKMFGITHVLDKVFCNNIPILSGSRKVGLSIINSMNPLKNLIIKASMM
jgi:2-octaprenyl-6-methoxyphenol hydroxylase